MLKYLLTKATAIFPKRLKTGEVMLYIYEAGLGELFCDGRTTVCFILTTEDPLHYIGAVSMKQELTEMSCQGSIITRIGILQVSRQTSKRDYPFLSIYKPKCQNAIYTSRPLGALFNPQQLHPNTADKQLQLSIGTPNNIQR